tara:strand:+ start:230 stop:484 length:255 start_codon:yes stop_codon:yes gene_type:complete
MIKKLIIIPIIVFLTAGGLGIVLLTGGMELVENEKYAGLEDVDKGVMRNLEESCREDSATLEEQRECLLEVKEIVEQLAELRNP